MGSLDKRGNPLTADEWYTIFALTGTKKLQYIVRALKPRNRTTIARAHNVAYRLKTRGNKWLNESAVRGIVKGAGYGATKKYVYDADARYRIWLQRETGKRTPSFINNWEAHFKDMADTLHMLLPSLKAARNFETDKQVPFYSLVLTDAELDGSEYIDDQPHRVLLKHLKNEILSLVGFESWFNLSAADLTDELLDQLTVIDMRKTFRDRCEVCKDWPLREN